jgi:hypothetical protein
MRGSPLQGSLRRTRQCRPREPNHCRQEHFAANREHFVTLRGRDAFEYQTAIESPGLSIAQAATLLTENHRQLGGQATLAEACSPLEKKSFLKLGKAKTCSWMERHRGNRE